MAHQRRTVTYHYEFDNDREGYDEPTVIVVQATGEDADECLDNATYIEWTGDTYDYVVDSGTFDTLPVQIAERVQAHIDALFTRS